MVTSYILEILKFSCCINLNSLLVNYSFSEKHRKVFSHFGLIMQNRNTTSCNINWSGFLTHLCVVLVFLVNTFI